LQLLSAAGYSLGHGTNDAQKGMGIITTALVAGGLMKNLRRPLLGHPLLPSRHGWRHHGRRLAHHQDHGPAHHQSSRRSAVLPLNPPAHSP